MTKIWQASAAACSGWWAASRAAAAAAHQPRTRTTLFLTLTRGRKILGSSTEKGKGAGKRRSAGTELREVSSSSSVTYGTGADPSAHNNTAPTTPLQLAKGKGDGRSRSAGPSESGRRHADAPRGAQRWRLSPRLLRPGRAVGRFGSSSELGRAAQRRG